MQQLCLLIVQEIKHLHQSNPRHEEEQREPLVKTQPFPQHGDRKQCCGEDLQLISDL